MDLRKKIKERGFSLVKLGEAIGKSKSAMTTIVNGNPTFATLQSIADVLGISVSELVADDKQSSNQIVCPHCGKPLELDIALKKMEAL